LGIPTGESFFNRIIETKRLCETLSLGFDMLSAEFILSLSKGYELLTHRSLALAFGSRSTAALVV